MPRKHSIQARFSLLIIALLSSFSLHAYDGNAQTKKANEYPLYPNIEVSTNKGKFYLSLDAVRAPITTKNFLDYVYSGFYKDTIFHRVIPGFVVQGGGHDEEFRELITNDPIFNESGNGLSNLTGTIAMAREFDPHSARSQFYINLADNTNLDPRPDRWGYTVFGEVASGIDILQNLAEQPTGAGGDFEKDVPLKPFIVRSMRLMGTDEDIPLPKPETFENPENNMPADKAEEQVKQAKEKLLKKKAL